MQIEKLKQAFSEHFPGRQPTIASSAPGRVNLLGEHTDYNDGFVLPMAIDARITLLGALNGTNEVNLYSLDFEAKDSFSLEAITQTEIHRWSNYIRGVCDLLQKDGYNLAGMDIVLQGNVPLGAGLSSSAALEVATALFVDKLNDLKINKTELVKLAQRAENEFVGVNCGIMDQFISMLGEKDHALFLDCRSLDYQTVAARFEEAGCTLVVINSGVKRGLVDSEYNLRRSQCEEAVQLLKKDLPEITALRDVTIEHLDLINALPEALRKRARHVVSENQRVLDAIEFLKADNLEAFGELLYASHESLRDDYEVSCSELDLLVEIARSTPGTLGARMTGAGFGGSMIILTAKSAVEELKNRVMDEYTAKTQITPEIFTFKAVEGATIIPLD
jgi:galactokinase